MRRIITYFVRNPVAANLLMFLMVVGGIFGYLNLQREFIPQTTINGMSVSVSWPGASPRDVEQQLVVRIEEAVDGLDGIDYIEGNAREGSANVNIRTKIGIDYEKMLDQVKARVDGIQNLPPDAFRPQVFRWDARADIMYLALYGDMDRLTLQREATQLRQELSKLPGLQLTSQISKQDEQVTIEISEEALRRYGLTFSQVAQSISGASVNLSAGTVETTAGNLQLRARNLANSADEFEDIIVRQTAQGGTVRVGDIANVIDGFAEDDFDARFNGQTTAIFQVVSPDKMNITESGEAIRQFEQDVRDSLPPDLNFRIWFDGSTMFDSRMSLIGGNALTGLILVLIILALFLRPMVALWVTIGIGAAFMGAIAIAPTLGITLNMISLFAFLLVIGIVVDDAIVVGESIHLHNENGIEGERAAIGGAYMVAKPVFFAVVTTIIMFLPFLFMSGPIQAIFSQISLVVVAVLVFSLIEAFFILPAHLRHMKHVEPSSNALLRLQNKIAESLVSFAKNHFRPFVAMLIRWRYATLAFFLGMLGMAFALLISGIAPTAFIPEVEGDMISVNARFPEGTSFQRVSQARGQVDAGIARLNENAMADFGIEGPIIDKPGTIAEGRSIEGYLGLAATDERRRISSKDIADKLEEYVGPIPDAFRVQYGFTEGGSGQGGGLFYGVAASNEDDLRAAVLDIKNQLETYPDINNAWDGLESSASEIRFTLKPGAETLGITLADVTRQVREAFYGREVQRLPRNGEDVRVMVRYPEAARESIDSLNQLRIRAANGVEVPLYSVAEAEIAEGVGRINRRDRKRVEYTGARVRGEQSRSTEIRADMDENFFPQWEVRHPRASRITVGEDEIQQNFMRELNISLIAIVLATYILLAIAFRSYAQPFLILIALPFAWVGMIFGNLVTGVPFGMFSIFGFLAATGVAMNDNLVLIDYVNRLRAKGVGAYQAMLDACVARFRPILLTSVTTFVGLVPILFETSPQAEFLKPMVVALAFGVLFDFFLTLMLVPAMYGIGVDISRFFKGLWTGEAQQPFGSTYNPEMAMALDDFEIAADTGPATPTPEPQPAE
ncbi:efflux RND transporter permease subunit [Algimonas porphyrae]|uniref:Acriflavin resistance protein n=1 Tax=Algimonas porphyrae TaxID=1128113 RepID=A0ABQ5UXG0_9PROT|nr:efflux RND transporter permease subunit [Algimonas porphyrae]GLQ19984.1 acriflavin resistance protein [Algimonas porphyrae]